MTAKAFCGRCAQRLSASLFVPLGKAGKAAPRPMCSTPFGIIVRSTINRRLATTGETAGAQRLSASLFVPRWISLVVSSICRRCSTPFGIIVRSTSAKPARRRRGRCAQRLSASLFVPLQGGNQVFIPPEVLNAFRHHCSFHIKQLLLILLSPTVLNAFRHHCSFHDQVAHGVEYVAGAQRLSASLFVPHCRTRPRKRLPHRAQRLSASLFVPPRARIRRGRLSAGAQRLSASLFVPPGRSSPTLKCEPRAQRLSASLFVPPRIAVPPDQSSAGVLNAFRHHCSFHRRGSPRSGSAHNCAQRLSASLFVPRLAWAFIVRSRWGAQRLSASLFVPRCSMGAK